jgi:osmotically-inducible protein OsmY
MTQDTQLSERLRLDVVQEFEGCPDLDASLVEIEVRNRRVTLRGIVGRYLDKSVAGELVKIVPGVQSVANQIAVLLPETGRKEDGEVFVAALQALAGELRVPRSGIDVSVRRGWIRLRGTVRHKQQKEYAERCIGGLPGLVGVQNLIVVADERN